MQSFARAVGGDMSGGGAEDANGRDDSQEKGSSAEGLKGVEGQGGRRRPGGRKHLASQRYVVPGIAGFMDPLCSRFCNGAGSAIPMRAWVGAVEYVRPLELNRGATSAGIEPEGYVSWSRTGGPRQLVSNRRAAKGVFPGAPSPFAW